MGLFFKQKMASKQALRQQRSCCGYLIKTIKYYPIIPGSRVSVLCCFV